MTYVQIRVGGLEVRVRLRSDTTPTARGLLSVLPVSTTAHRWGDEVYFELPFHADLEPDARADMSVGEVAFWPDGDAMAVFFGRTPVSEDERPRAYSPCNIVGSVEGDPTVLRAVREGSKVELIAVP
ncbi:MAG TPA: cyclophilin-like fold protein [Thermoplasmata archaeon]